MHGIACKHFSEERSRSDDGSRVSGTRYRRDYDNVTALGLRAEREEASALPRASAAGAIFARPLAYRPTIRDHRSRTSLMYSRVS